MGKVSFLLILSLVYFASAIAQSPNGTINGIVLDPSGAAIAGAEIVVVNVATGVQNATKTNGEGIYVVPNLPPGPYRIQVSSSGFKTIIKPDIVIHVQDALAINFTLSVGAASEVVTVPGGAPLVNTENASVGTVIDRRFVENLPLNGRSFNTLLQLTPGVVIAPTNGFSPGQFSIAGQRTDANNFTVDGVSANFGVVTTPGPAQSGTGSNQAVSALGGTSSLVSVEALQEFRIETSSVAPEFGRSPGGQVILTTRSGTNDFHGGIFEYFRNEVMDANDWFANAANKPRAPERHNDFGGFSGGPIWKDKTFFFISYEGARLRLPQATTIAVPSTFARSQTSATLAPFLNAYPLPDDRTLTPGAYTSPFTGVWSNRGTLNAGSVRVDHVLNARFAVFGRYNEAPSQLVSRINSLSMLSSADVNTRTATFGLNMFLSSRMSNTFRSNYSRQLSASTFSLDSFGGAVQPAPNLLLGSPSSPDDTAVVTIGAVTGTTYETGHLGKNTSKQFNFSDDFSVVRGKHQMKYGADFRVIYLNARPSLHQASFQSSSVQAFLTSGGVASLSASTSAAARIRSQSVSLYAQDTWKASSRATLTYGVRWELSPAPVGLGSTTLASWTNVENPSQIALATSGTPVWRTSYTAFAPRMGVAYALTKTGDFVLRAGGGIFYDLGIGASATLVFDFPNTASSFIPSVQLPISSLAPFSPALSRQPPYPSFVTKGFSPDLKMPRSYQWNLSLEKSFGGNQMITATYVGQAGRDLLREEAFFQPNPNFAGDFLLTQNDAFSNYHALQLQYRKPLSGGLQALLNYTWSHSLDNASDDVIDALSNTVISAARDYASSSFDVRQSFSGALTYDIHSIAKDGPLAHVTKGWSADGVIVARSGFPFNAISLLTSPDPARSALARPDIVPGQPLWISNPAAPGGKSLNPAAFAIPSTVRQGTESRNDIPGFGLTQVDLSIGRRFSIAERFELQFRADAFNVLNHPNFTNPQAFVGFGSAFLQSTSMLNRSLGGLNPLFQQGGPRSLQLSLKLAF